MDQSTQALANSRREYADFETSSADYARRFSGPAGEWLLSIQSKILTAIVGNLASPQVLDVGGGHGQVALPLSQLGIKVTIIGSSEAAAGGIRELLEAGKCSLMTGDLLQTGIENKSFEVVTCFRLIPHCDEWKSLIKELCRISKNRVIVDYPTTQSVNFLTNAFFWLKKGIEKNTRTYTLFTHREIREEFEKNGFRVAKRYGEFFLPMVFHRIIKFPAASAFLESICGLLGLKALFGSPVIVEAKRIDA